MKNLKGINLAIIILSSILILTFGFCYMQINNDKIAKNTYIKDVNVGNLSKEDAKEKILNEYKMNTITFKYNDKTWHINPNDIDTNYDIEQTIDNAYKVNRSKNIFSNIVDTLKSTFGIKNHISLIVDCDEAKVTSQLEKISQEVSVSMKDAKLDVSGNNIEISQDKAGLQVDISATISNLKKSLQKGIFEESLVIIKVEPKIKKEDLKDINTLLGSYQTVLVDVSPGRIENIKIATQRTSGVLLMPGEEFSYNKHTGLRTVKNGYKNATVIVSGEAVQGVGGGVCQVSTTLYNAVLYAGLDIVNVSNHSIPSNYVDKGRDAVVSDSGLDFVFKNDYDKPVYIKNYYNNGTITCQVYGNNKEKQNIKISTSIDKVTKAPTKEEKDPTLEKGKEKVLEFGRDSYSVSTYRIYYDENGKEVKKEKVASSFYPSKQKVVAIGTKKEEKPAKKEANSSEKEKNNSTTTDNSNKDSNKNEDKNEEKDNKENNSEKESNSNNNDNDLKEEDISVEKE
ncbi:Vancomycin resistance protein YoaR, contains peptidoglycan-binding and VanW domains [Terrisporobacter glycolicus]|nr:Vancomycin resistance protein YoaR, contains peptidoglycan-binding and VanW domains [Terrisporobacter glycolicus]